MMLIKQHRYSNKWKIVLFWIVANTISIALGLWFGALLNDNLWPSPDVPPNITWLIENPFQRFLVLGLSIGCLAGLVEWFVLRKWSVGLGSWVVVTVAGWVLGLTIALIIRNEDLSGITGGIILGFAQWIILRHYLSNAYWWIIAWGISGWIVINWIPVNLSIFELFYYQLQYFLVGFIPSVITGLTLILLLKEAEIAAITTNKIK